MPVASGDLVLLVQRSKSVAVARMCAVNKRVGGRRYRRAHFDGASDDNRYQARVWHERTESAPYEGESDAKRPLQQARDNAVQPTASEPSDKEGVRIGVGFTR